MKNRLKQFNSLSMLGQLPLFIEQLCKQTKHFPYIQILSFNTHYQLIIGDDMIEIAMGGKTYNRINFINRKKQSDNSYKIIQNVTQEVSGKGAITLIRLLHKISKHHLQGKISDLFISQETNKEINHKEALLTS